MPIFIYLSLLETEAFLLNVVQPLLVQLVPTHHPGRQVHRAPNYLHQGKDHKKPDHRHAFQRVLCTYMVTYLNVWYSGDRPDLQCCSTKTFLFPTDEFTLDTFNVYS